MPCKTAAVLAHVLCPPHNHAPADNCNVMPNVMICISRTQITQTVTVISYFYFDTQIEYTSRLEATYIRTADAEVQRDSGEQGRALNIKPKFLSSHTTSPFSKAEKTCHSSYNLARHSGPEHKKYTLRLTPSLWTSTSAVHVSAASL